MASENRYIRVNQLSVTTYPNGSTTTNNDLDWGSTISRTWSRNGKQRPESPYSCYRDVDAAVKGVMILGYGMPFGNDKVSTTKGYVGVGVPRPGSYDSGCDRAVTKALAQFKDGGFNAALFFAEGRKAIDMIADRTHQVRDFLSWAHGDRKGSRGRRTPDQVQKAWLEVQYGWLPLLNDLSGALSALAGNLNKEVVVAKASAASEETKVNKTFATGTGYPTIAWEKSRAIIRNRSACVVKLKGLLNSRAAATAASLGLTNPLELAWELIPYSFVVDWFVPIGNTLSAIDATTGYTFAGGSITRFYKGEVEATVDRATWNTSTNNTCVQKGDGTGMLMTLNRQVYTGFPFPPPPRFKNPLSVTHGLNAIALLTDVLRRR